MPKKLSRRTLLRGAGGAAIGLPFLEAMLGPNRSVAQPSEIPKRVVFFFTACGPDQDFWWPSGGETSFTLNRNMQPLAPFRDKLMILDDVAMETAINNGGNGHDRGTAHCLVARRMVPGPMGSGEFGHLWDGSAGGISIDQHIADHVGDATPFKSLEFGNRAEGIAQALPSRISYRGQFNPVIPMHTPGAAFDRVFLPLTGDVEEQRRLQRRRELVLGAVQGDLSRLRSNLGAADRTRVDAHVAAISDITARLGELSGAVCEVPTRQDASEYPMKGQLQLDLIAEALKCDLTRVASIQWSTGQSGVRFNWLGHMDGHHSLSHRGISDAEAKAQIGEIDHWYSEQFAYLLGRLESVEVGDGQTLLDYTTVVWCNEQEQGIGNIHRFTRMPYVIAGGGGGFWNTGRYVQLPSRRAHGDLMVSLMHMMGMSDETFGDPEYCTGPITELHA